MIPGWAFPTPLDRVNEATLCCAGQKFMDSVWCKLHAAGRHIPHIAVLFQGFGQGVQGIPVLCSCHWKQLFSVNKS